MHALKDSPITEIPSLQPLQFGDATSTAKGNVVTLISPDNHEILLDDIASSLARLSLYNGQTRTEDIYSIAIRSAWVAMYLQKTTGDPELALHGLMFRSAAAYVGVSMLPKDTLQIDLETNVKRAIYEALDMPVLTTDQVTQIEQANAQAIAVELTALLPEGAADKYDLPPINKHANAIGFMDPVRPWIATGAFLNFFERLQRGEQL